MRKILILLSALFAAVLAVQAQDDELPPPSSRPQQFDTTQYHPNADNNFVGFHKTKKVDFSKFILEPDFNFNIAGGRIDVGVSPVVGYNVWKGLYLGGTVTYLYTGFRNIEYVDPIGRSYYANANWHTFGGGVIAQYNIWRGFFARARFEVLHRIMDDIESNNITIQQNTQNGTYTVQIPKVEKTIPALILGGGYNLLRSKNFFFPIMVSYNVLYGATDKNYSIYPHGWIIQLGFVNIF